jgi:hypothetical protein
LEAKSRGAGEMVKIKPLRKAKFSGGRLNIEMLKEG